MTKQAQTKVSELADKAQHQAGQIADQAQEQVKTAARERKAQTVSNLEDISQAIRSTGQTLRDNDQGTVAQYTEKMAQQVDQLANYLDEKEIDQIVGDIENVARRRPELFLAGAFGLGLLVGRFLKSSHKSEAIVPAGYYDTYDIPFEERRSYGPLPRH
jgi:hypothetical protein